MKNARLISFMLPLVGGIAHLSLSGCHTTDQAMEMGGNKARKLVGDIDPTGFVSDTTQRKELMFAAR